MSNSFFSFFVAKDTLTHCPIKVSYAQPQAETWTVQWFRVLLLIIKKKKKSTCFYFSTFRSTHLLFNAVILMCY